METGSTTKLVHVLLGLQRQRATGVFSVRSADIHTLVYFLNGRAVFAQEGTLGETLGRILVDKGLISNEQYTHAINVMKQQVAANSSMRMGELLVQLGYVGVPEVQEALVSQMGRRIARLMQFDQLSWELDPSESKVRAVPTYPMRVEPMVLDGIRLFHDRRTMSFILRGFLSGYVMLRASVELVTRCFGLPPEGEQLLRELDGTQTLQDWLGSDEQTDEAWAVATALAMTGVLASAPSPPSSRSLERVAAENPSLSHPGSTGRFEMPVVRQGNALQQPIPRAARAAPAQAVSDERLSAESSYRRGIELMRESQFEKATKEFEVAARALPNVAEYRLHEAWSRANERGTLDKKRLPELESLAMTAAKQDSQHAFPSYVLGHVALASGDKTTALRYFRIAKHRDHTDPDAAAQIKRLGG